MRLLFLTAELPEPAHAGGTLRTNGLLRVAHAAGPEVHLLSFATRGQLNAQRDRLAAYCARVETVSPPQRRLADRLRDLLLTDKADMQGRCFSAHYQHALAKLLEETPYDLVQIESLEMTVYAPVVRRVQPTTPLIYDSFNAEFDLQRSIFETERGRPARLPGALYSFVQWRRLTRYERQVVREATHTIAVSDADAEAFRRLAPGCPVSVVPNGIDVARHAIVDMSLDLGPAPLVFTGSMGYRPNVDAALWFANHVLDRVRAHVPEARFFIVGSRPHRRLNSLRDRDGVQITGWVPDVHPFLSAAAVYVVPPRRGRGTRRQQRQALAARPAGVTTPGGAPGLDVQDGAQLRLADTEETFARAVIELLRDPTERTALGERAAQYVARGYDWSVIAPRLLAVYDEVLGSARVPEGSSTR